MTNQQPTSSRFLRLLAEFTVIFLSVVLAFFFEDFRESRNEKEQYIEAISMFAVDIEELIKGLYYETDSFRVTPDNSRGHLLEKILILNWFDSLLNQKNASMSDFKFIIESRLLGVPITTETYLSPLVEEIRTKYGEYAHPGIKSRFLLRYEREMKNLSAIDFRLKEFSKYLQEIIMRTDPYYNFTDEDSLLFYSNEFMWSYRRYVNTHQYRYQYKRFWLAQPQKRLIDIAEAVNAELDRYGAPTERIRKCYEIEDFIQRYTCWEDGFDPEKDSIISINSLVRERIRKYKTGY